MSSHTYNAKDVEPVVVQMNREIRALLTERTAINRRIDTIRKALVGLATLMGDEILKETIQYCSRKSRRGKNGITGACRVVLMNSENPLPAKEVYQQVCLKEPALLADYTTPMTPLYAVLGRLVKRGEVRIVTDASGRRAWQWIHAPSVRLDHGELETPNYI
jgi:hypothetical protein